MPIKNVESKRNSLHYPLTIDGKDMEEELLKPFTYLTSVPGKKIRHNLIEVLGYWITVAEDKIPHIETLAHYIHNGSLLCDDIQDYSELRRGVPAAHTVFGISRTIDGTNWIMAYMYDVLDQLNDAKLSRYFYCTMRETFAGQGMELYWRDNYICPTEKEYLQMIYRKTGLVFLLVQNVMNTFSTGKKIDAGQFLTTLGMYFQINDDYQNLKNQMYFDSKGFCEDIGEGKFSFPMVHAINNFPEEGTIIIDILRKRTTDIELKKQCVAILEKCGSFEHTRRTLEKLKANLYAQIEKYDENPLIHEFLDKAMVACL